MRLLRVQVPEFRALKDVDISFEPDFNPQVFPLGSLNGGGKSTLLQLIFVLLSHLSNPQQDVFLKQMLSELQLQKNHKLLAKITLLINNENLILEFFYAKFPLIEKQPNKVCYYKGLLDTDIGLIGFIQFENEENQNKISKFQQEIAQKLFLITQPNQPYLFLDRNIRRSLFTVNNKPNYEKAVRDLQLTLPNFFTFDFTDVLIEVCRLARDKDFDEHLETGSYGTHYMELEKSINSLFLDGKKIVPLTIKQKRHQTDSIQSMGFKLPSGEEIYPEDLSHGELKRLTIFVLLKYHEMQDAVVLMDEIENGFHLDWQYTIVRNLVEWGKNNQYILATHSYELCTALTPAHVKEIEPKLTAK